MLKKVLPVLLVLGVLALALPLGVAAASGGYGPEDGERLAMGAGLGGPGGWRGGGMSLVDATAQATGLSEDEVITALTDGKTFAEIAQENDVSLQDIVDIVIAARSDGIQAAVDDGRLTQEQADEMLSEMSDHLLEVLQQPWTAHMGRSAAQGFGRGMSDGTGVTPGRGQGRGRGNMGAGRGLGTGVNCPLSEP